LLVVFYFEKDGTMNTREKQQLEAQLREDTCVMLDIIWSLVEEESFDSLAKRSGLSLATVYRLWGGAWKKPQLLTIQKLALAVGLEIRLSKDGIRASLAV
jgi:transcriptional regulator with XRE-family HTH domain